jgi:hypothetical protein
LVLSLRVSICCEHQCGTGIARGLLHRLLSAVMRLRIIQRLPISGIDGIRLDRFEVGAEYEVGNTTAALLLAEGWAEPVPLDAPAPAEPFVSEEPIDPTPLLRQRHDLVRKMHQPTTVRAKAADASGKSRR